MFDRKKAEKTKESQLQPVASTPDIQPVGAVESELATAIGVALHLHFSGRRQTATSHFFTPILSPWARQGRERIMNARSIQKKPR
jgi:hypothetical protein